MTEFIEVRTAISEKEEADEIAEKLVREHLAACVQVVGPITSAYRWEGKLEVEEEFLLFIKTRKSMFPDVRMRIEELHTYELPEIISLPIVGSSGPYLDWMEESTR
jgi:periplasmic divalent cation tolerance protein